MFSQIACAQGPIEHTKFWFNGNLTSPVTNKNKKFKFLVESRLRLIDDRYLFEHYRISGGLGYELSSSLTGFAGIGYVIDESTTGVFTHEYRPFQLLKWDIHQSKSFHLKNNSLLEERKQVESPVWAYRLRERFAAEFPLKKWKKHSFDLSNEFFFNLNHPKWVSNYFYAENRAIIGIGSEVSKSIEVTVGYINQYQHVAPRDKMSNGLIITLDMKR